MEAVSVSRAIMSGGLWMAVAYGMTMALGTDASLTDIVLDGGMMSASAIGADMAHGMLGWNPTGTTSAVLTGAYFAGLQKLVRGDSNYMVNAGAAAVNDFLVEKVSQAQRNSQLQAQLSTEEEEY
jgi:hypothetical protein